MKEKKRYVGLITLMVFAITYIVLYSEIKSVSGQNPSLKNMLVYGVFSLIIGGLFTAFYVAEFKILLSTFIAGNVIGFMVMHQIFASEMDGWGDLVGLITLFLWIMIGLGIGGILQIGAYFLRKRRG